MVLCAAAAVVFSSGPGRTAPSPLPEKTYAAFFLGQGGYLFSWGIPHLASQARALGAETDIFQWSDVAAAYKKISRKKAEGYKIALVGYSLGNTATTYLQKHVEVDLLLAIAESSLGRNHSIDKRRTKRSILWHGPDVLSNAGVKDGFDKTNYVGVTHLWMDVDSRVVSGVVSELKNLVETRRENERASAVASGPDHLHPALGDSAPASAGAGVASQSPAKDPAPSSDWRGGALAFDITCPRCRGFRAPDSVGD